MSERHMSEQTTPHEPAQIGCAVRGSFQDWLSRASGSVMVTTYQAGKVAVVGWDGAQVTLLMRDFDKPLGLAVQGKQVALACRHELWMLADSPLLAPDYIEDQPGRYDSLYVPRATYHTGDLHTHDVAFEGEELLLVNTRFSCLARLSREYNFTPVWKPKFVTDLVPEDRCHLNGLAIRDGRPRYVTALGVSDSAGGWRQNKAGGGVLIDVASDEIVLQGLSMPHSPRWHNDRLWLLNSGAGELLVVDPASGKPEVVCGFSGYLRGLFLLGPYALVGLSRIREKHIFGGLPIQERTAKLLCGVAVVDLRSGTTIGMFEFTAGCEELYDIAFLPGARRPMILNLQKPAAYQAMTSPDSSYWLRPSAEIQGQSSEIQGQSSVTVASGENQIPSLGCGPSGGDLQSEGNLLPDSGTQL